MQTIETLKLESYKAWHKQKDKWCHKWLIKGEWNWSIWITQDRNWLAVRKQFLGGFVIQVVMQFKDKYVH